MLTGQIGHSALLTSSAVMDSLLVGMNKDPLDTGEATHSSTLAWRIPWTEEPGGLQSIGLQELDMSE